MSSPFNHFIPVAAVSPKGRDIVISATSSERHDVAAECDLADVSRLEATFHLSKGAGPILAVQGSISADIVQTCGVSLEPVPATIEAEVALTFTLDAIKSRVELDIDLVDEDPPEPVQDGQIDFGALAVEHMVLNLDPYPRAPEVAFDAQKWLDSEHSSTEPPGSNPFAALSKLKPGGRGGE